MKRNMIVLFVLSLFLNCCPICNHVHTEECGENGVECTHICPYSFTEPGENPNH